MKLFKLVIILFAVNSMSCEDLNSSSTHPSQSDHEHERKVLELNLEVGQLRKENGDMRIENANLRLELLSTKENEKLLRESNELTYMNCSGLMNHTEIITGNLKTLWENLHSFKSYINQKMAEYATKYGKKAVNSTTEEPRSLYESPQLDEELFKVACDAKLANGTWTVIQRRMNGETNFYRPWEQYKAGFGNKKTEFFIGLDNLHILTTCSDQELLIEMEDNENEKRHAQYDLFEVGSERESYKLKEVGTYSGDAGDSLSYHKSQKFSTFDEDNDSDSSNCAKLYKGAWWHKACHTSNLNGQYGNNENGEGINWKTFSGYEQSLKFIEMKIRPKSD